MSVRKFKTVAVVATAAVLLGSLGACSSAREPEPAGSDGGAAAEGDTTIGIAMPTRSLERWNKDGSNLEGLLQEAGYETSL